MMRILTVRQPWAWAIIHGGKDVENRPRNIAGAYRGPVAIHAGLAYDHSAHLTSEPLRDAQDSAAVAAGAETFPGGYLWDIGRPDPRKAWSVQGAIIGVVDLADMHQSHECAVFHEHSVEADPVSRCSSWADPHMWHLELANPRSLSEPIPYRGALGLRTLPVDVVAAINERTQS